MKYNIKNDYIMNSELSRFDNYNEYDIMGIESDLEEIISDNEINYDDKIMICDKYTEVITYIKKRLDNGN